MLHRGKNSEEFEIQNEVRQSYILSILFLLVIDDVFLVVLYEGREGIFPQTHRLLDSITLLLPVPHHKDISQKAPELKKKATRVERF